MIRLLELWRALAQDHAEAHFDGCLEDAVQDALIGILALTVLLPAAVLAVAAVSS